MNRADLKALQQTRAQVHRDLDALRKKYGEVALPAFRRYLSDIAERTKREKEIARLRRELDAINNKKKGR